MMCYMKMFHYLKHHGNKHSAVILQHFKTIYLLWKKLSDFSKLLKKNILLIILRKNQTDTTYTHAYNSFEKIPAQIRFIQIYRVISQ